MQKIYIVRLSEEERNACLEVIKKLKGTSQKVRRAHILLKADADGPNWTDQEIADAFFCTRQCVENLRKRLVTDGFDIALHGKKRTTPSRKLLDGEQEAKIIALRLSDPPTGRNGWTLRLLAEKVVELEIVPAISHVTVAKTLKKNEITNRKVQQWVIPPKSNGEFVARMESVLDLYALPYDPKIPVIVMDEQPVQLLRETRVPIPATRHHARRIDYEYERAGVANIFMFSCPLGCWRRVSVRERKTKIDWAVEMALVLEKDFPLAEKIRLVCDNLNVHSLGALYEAFDPERARMLARRLEIVPTPKHGSWLNIAENELSALTAQCVKGVRFGTIEELRKAVEAWAKMCNDNQKGVKWQFSTDNARIKLENLYPKFLY